MKKYLALGLLSTLLLTSCSVDWNDTKDKKIRELEKQVTEMRKDKELELQKFEFEKQKYEEGKEIDKKKEELKGEELKNKATQIEKNIKDISFRQKQECAKFTEIERKSIIKDINPIYRDEFKIFYSPKQDACIKSLKRDFETFTVMRIDNIQTNENIILCNSRDDYTCRENIDSIIKELKGE